MTLAKRIIPCLDVKDGRVVKGVNFEGLRDAGDPVELSTRYRDEGADEVVFLDITASLESRKTISSLVRNVAASLDIPFTVGGGIRSMADARLILASGADKIAVNTAALQDPGLITRLAGVFGSQCVVVAIDAKRVKGRGEARGDEKKKEKKEEGKEGMTYEVFSHSATKTAKVDAIEWAEKAADLGAGELLVTSIDRDGTKEGYDIDLLRSITSKVNVPVIASGGCGTLGHFYDALSSSKVGDGGGGCDAALAASLFHYREVTVKQVKDYLAEKGVVVRP